MNKNQEQVLLLQKIDPIAIAENMVGESYKDNQDASNLGFVFHMQKAAEMNGLLKSIGDTTFRCRLSEYLKIVTDFGFKIVYKEEFKTDRPINETYYVLFLKELGIVLEFDTYTWADDKEPGINSAEIHYNWSPHNLYDRRGLTSTGSFVNRDKQQHIGLFNKDLKERYDIPNYPVRPEWNREIPFKEYLDAQEPIEKEQKELLNLALECGKRTLWVGCHDAREALITTIKSLFENGIFATTWHECSFNWLTHYMEHKDFKLNMEEEFKSLEQITIERLNKMPQEVRDCINGTYEKQIEIRNERKKK